MLLLANGPTPVYFARRELSDVSHPPEVGITCARLRDDYREQYISIMLESVRPAVELKMSSLASVEWPGEGNFRAQVAEALQNLRDQFRRAADQMTGSPRWLTVDEAAALKPRIEVLIQDYRADQSPRLPSLSPGDGAFTVVSHFGPPLD